MTEEYKERLIKYLTNKLDIDTASNVPFFATDIEIKTLTESLYTYFDTIQGYIQGKDGKGNNLNIGFVYGYNSNNKGVIAVVDNSFNIIQVITEYNTETDFNKWVCLNIDNVNGNIYGVDDQNGQYRFILLNNFLNKKPAQTEYSVELRQSYFVDFLQDGYNRVPTYVEKSPSSSLYLLIGDKWIFTYEIKVGESNELKYYPYNGNENIDLKGYNIIWNESNYSVKIGGQYEGTSGNYNNHYIELGFETGDTELSVNIDLEFNTTTAEIMFYENIDILDLCITNTTTYIGYYGVDKRTLGSKIECGIFKVDYDEEKFISLFNLQKIPDLTDYVFNVQFFKKSNQIYFYASRNVNSPAIIANQRYEVTIGLIDDEDNILSKTSNNLEIYSLVNTSTLFNVVQEYNLLTYNLIGSTTTALQVRQIYNDLNYNFEDYENTNSLVPKSVLLYDEDDNVIYARNLYNKVLNENTTTSTVEIPNTLLNDIEISKEDLLGATNGILVSNEQTIEKNIYEDLFINFINTINITDNNNGQNISNNVGATRLNNSSSNTADYANVALTKIRLNYKDHTSFTKTISTSQVSQYKYRITSYIFVGKKIKSIELISNDEQTTYLTIDGSNFETNKTYKISQDVEIQ